MERQGVCQKWGCICAGTRASMCIAQMSNFVLREGHRHTHWPASLKNCWWWSQRCPPAVGRTRKMFHFLHPPLFCSLLLLLLLLVLHLSLHHHHHLLLLLPLLFLLHHLVFFPPPTSCPPVPSSSYASVLFLFLFQVFLLLHPPLFLLILFISYSCGLLSQVVSHTRVCLLRATQFKRNSLSKILKIVGSFC